MWEGFEGHTGVDRMYAHTIRGRIHCVGYKGSNWLAGLMMWKCCVYLNSNREVTVIAHALQGNVLLDDATPCYCHL